MFSGAVKIGDLSDFIAPSQACVVALDGGKVSGTAADAQDEVGTVQLQQRPSKAGGFSQTLPAAAGEGVKVSLHDCLACSGCVTSAETVLLQHQSTGELLQRLADPAWTVVVSLSPQSVAALAVLHGLSPVDCAGRLVSFLRRLGAAAVFDIAAARQLALAEAAAEFLQRFRASPRGAAALAAAAAGGDAMEVDAPGGGNGSSGGFGGGGGEGPLPMLASACPGWVCYAEKTHGDHVLPFISTGKSPQAAMGSLVKRRWCGGVGADPARVYHCAVMPCYDKKLEASRDDFLLPGAQAPETDCVLATTELLELLREQGQDLAALPPAPWDGILPAAPAAGPGAAAAAAAPAAAQPPAAGASDGWPAGSGSSGGGAAGTAAASSGSGGYVEHVFRAAARELFGQQLPPGPLEMRVGRNADLREVTLEVGGTPVLRFAAAYGFRNIQGLMRKVKLARCEYDYVEVMACPSGCLNGGGQPKPVAGQTPAQLIEQVEALYDAGLSSSGRPPPEADGAVAALYREWVGGPPGSAPARQLLHTAYHRREKTVGAALADW